MRRGGLGLALFLLVLVSAAACGPPGPAVWVAVAEESCPAGKVDRPGFERAVVERVRAESGGLDFWTGERIPAGAFQVDHVMPWGEALCSGLSEASHEAFYNDPANLVAASASVNAAKSDWWPGSCSSGAKRRPTGSCVGGGWSPPDPDRRCVFLDRYTAVKRRWGLSVDVAEVEDLIAERAHCAL